MRQRYRALTLIKNTLTHLKLIKPASFRPVRVIERLLSCAFLIILLVGLLEARDGIHTRETFILMFFMSLIYFTQQIISEIEWSRVFERLGDQFYNYHLSKTMLMVDRLQTNPDHTFPAQHTFTKQPTSAEFDAGINNTPTKKTNIPTQHDVGTISMTYYITQYFARFSILASTCLIWAAGIQGSRNDAAHAFYKMCWYEILDDIESPVEAVAFGFSVLWETTKIITVDAPLTRLFRHKLANKKSGRSCDCKSNSSSEDNSDL